MTQVLRNLHAFGLGQQLNSACALLAELHGHGVCQLVHSEKPPTSHRAANAKAGDAGQLWGGEWRTEHSAVAASGGNRWAALEVVRSHSGHRLLLLGKLFSVLQAHSSQPSTRNTSTHTPVTHRSLRSAQYTGQCTDATSRLNGFFECFKWCHNAIITFVLALVNTFGVSTS